MKNSLLLLFLLAMPAAAVETTVKGGRMELLDKGEKVLFRNGVRLERGNDVMEANEMVTTKSRDRMTATGNVRLRRVISSTETWKGRGNHGFYNAKTGEGYLEGMKERAHLTRTEVLSSTVTREINMLADRIDFAKNSQAIAHGRVYAKTVDPETNSVYEFWSEHAVYDGNQKVLTLSGTEQPIVKESAVNETKTIKGNVITYRVQDKVFVSDGDAVAVFVGDAKQ